MKKKILALALCAIIIIALVPSVAFADMGPKPSVEIEITGITGEYYVTLLSKNKLNGPYSVYDKELDNKYTYNEDVPDDIWQKFVDYKDSDGYYYLQYTKKLSGNDTYRWGYYPPYDFKILIYVPSTDTFLVSEAYERYAFSSYYKLDASLDTLIPTNNYNYCWEIFTLLLRIVLTIGIEIAVALLFRFNKVKQLLLILITNCVTQILLNLTLSIINYLSGGLAYLIFFVIFEILVFIIEAIVYLIFMKKVSDEKPKAWLVLLYAFAANAASVGVGILLIWLIPSIL